MGIILTSAAVTLKAGAGVSDALTETKISGMIMQAESTLCAATRHDWVADYAGISENTKYILEETAAGLAAIEAVKFDMSGYTSRLEAEDIINVLRDAVLRNISILRDVKTREFLGVI